MSKKIESKVADTILQRPLTIDVAGKAYKMGAPSVATLILISETAAQLPKVNLDAENVLAEVLRTARDYRLLGEVVATMILGAKGLTENRTKVETHLFGLIRRNRKVTVDRRAELAEALLLHKSPRELSRIIADCLAGLEVSDFFGITASLSEVSLTKATREAEMTAFGQSSSEQ